MPGSTYSSNLKIELMTTGENSGTWGDITNTNLGTALEQAVIGLGNPDYVSDANLTISITNSNASQAARCLVLNVTSTFGSLTQTRELVVPTIQKQYIVQNNTSGGQSITVKTSAGTGITVPNGRKAHLYVNGTDVIQMFDFVNLNGGTIDNMTIGATTASSGKFTTLNASGATTLDGTVALGNAAGDLITVPGTIGSNLIFTDNTYDIGASGATRPRNLFLAGAATVGGNLSVGGTLTLTGGVNLNGNVTVGDASTDTLTINSTITSNLIFTDNTYDIGASGATRPRNLFLAGNATIGGAQTLTGALTVDSTTDSSSTTTGSIQTDGGVGIAKALYVGTTANIAGAVTLSGGTANGVTYLNGSKVLTSGSALTFNGTNTFTVIPATGTAYNRTESTQYSTFAQHFAASGNTGVEYKTAYRFVDTDVGELMRLNSTGLGIGTSSPSSKLDVSGVISLQGTTLPTAGTARIFSRSSDSSTYIQTATGGNFYLLDGSQNSMYAARSTSHEWATNNTTKMTLDSAGNLGLGVTPSAWSVGKAIEVGNVGNAFWGVSATQISITQNAYFDGSWKYAANGYATRFQEDSGAYIWNTSPNNTSGAGAGITFTAAMTLDASGNLGVGQTSPGAKLEAAGNLRITNATATNSAIFQVTSDATGSNGVNLESTYYGSGGFGPIKFTTSGTERARITSSGDVQISTSKNDDTTLYVQNGNAGTASTARFDLRDSSSHYLTMRAYGQNATGTTFGISNAKLSAIFDNSSAAESSGLVIGTSPAMPLMFGTNSTERARIDSSGALMVGSTSWLSTSAYQTGGLQFGGSTYAMLAMQTGGTTRGQFLYDNANAYLAMFNCGTFYVYNTSAGVYLSSGGTSWTSNSDERLKDIIEPITDAANKISQLRAVIGKFKTDAEGTRRSFLIAQDVQAVLPEAVTSSQSKDQDQEYLGVSYTDVIPLLVAAIKEQNTIIESLKARLDAANL